MMKPQIWDLKSLIYECTGYDPEKWNFELITRVNSGTPPTFTKLPILSEATWRGMYGRLKANGTMITKIYVKRVPRESGVESFDQNSVVPNYEPQGEPYTPVAPCFVLDPEPYSKFTPPALQP